MHQGGPQTWIGCLSDGNVLFLAENSGVLPKKCSANMIPTHCDQDTMVEEICKTFLTKKKGAEESAVSYT